MDRPNLTDEQKEKAKALADISMAIETMIPNPTGATYQELYEIAEMVVIQMEKPN